MLIFSIILNVILIIIIKYLCDMMIRLGKSIDGLCEYVDELPDPVKKETQYKSLKDFYKNAKPGDILKMNLRR